MKIMILSLLMTAGYFTSTQTTSPGESEIIEYLSNVYNVEELNVELSSPNLVNVRLNSQSLRTKVFTIVKSFNYDIKS